MNSMAMGLVVFACVFGGALCGLFLSTKLAAHHLSKRWGQAFIILLLESQSLRERRRLVPKDRVLGHAIADDPRAVAEGRHVAMHDAR